MKTVSSIAAALLAMAMLAAPATAQPAENGSNATVPGGPTSLQETFENWTLQCAATEKGRICNVQQQQRHRENRQLVLAVELSSAANNAVTGALVLPFGLRLGSGATLQIDDQPASAPGAFSTCLPVGCLVPLNFDKAMIGRLRSGNVLKITVTAQDDGKPIALTVALKGLPSALDRLAALTQPVPTASNKK